jgi:hypothetical protein
MRAGWRTAKDGAKRVSLDIVRNAHVSDVIVHHARQLQSGTSVARITGRRFVLGDDGRIDVRKAVTGFDNSARANRCSGGGYAGAQPGYYVATRGRNGLYPSITSEAGYYAHKAEYAELQQIKAEKGGIALERLRTFYAGSVLLPPESIVIAYETLVPVQAWNWDEGRDDLQAVLREPLREYTERMRQIIAEAPKSEIDALMSPAARREIERLGAGTPMPLSVAMGLSDYSVSSAIGNAALAAGVAVQFPSVRSDIMHSDDYMNGGNNLVLPMSDGVPLDLRPTRVYTFDAPARRLQSWTIGEYADAGSGGSGA